MVAIPVALLDVFIVLLIITSVVLTYYAIRLGQDLARNAPVIGNWLRNALQAIDNAYTSVARAIIDDSIFAVIHGLRFLQQVLSGFVNAVTYTVRVELKQLHDGVDWTVAHVLSPAVAELKALHDGVDWWIANRIVPALAELKALHDGVDYLVAHVINPALTELRQLHDGINWVIAHQLLPALTVIKSIQDYLVWLDSHVIQPAIQDIISIKGVIEGIKGRIGAIEGTLAQVLPLIGAIGLTIPLARTLGRIARDPCYCFTQGGLQDNGYLELATLMDLI